MQIGTFISSDIYSNIFLSETFVYVPSTDSLPSAHLFKHVTRKCVLNNSLNLAKILPTFSFLATGTSKNWKKHIYTRSGIITRVACCIDDTRLVQLFQQRVALIYFFFHLDQMVFYWDQIISAKFAWDQCNDQCNCFIT